MSTPAPATAPVPAKAPAPPEDPGPLTYFLLPSDEHEEQCAREYLERKYGPGNRESAKRVKEIRIGRLTEKHAVIAVRRTDPRAGSKKEYDETLKKSVFVRHDDLAGFAESPPIKCADFWEPSMHEDGDGTMNMSTFLEALGKVSLPLAPRYRPDDQILKLLFV